MSDKTLPRPPQATFCGGAIVAISVLVVLLAFDRVSSLGSIEAQEEAQRFADSQGYGIGLSADTWQTVIRILCLVAGGVSVVTGYLGWRVLQRDRGARLALSILAPVALIAGSAVTAFIPATMTVAVVLLWRSPTRDWFDGRAAPTRPEPPARVPEPATPTTPSVPTAPPATQATALPSYAPPPGAPVYAPPPNPYRPSPATGTARPGTARPGGVTAASIVSIAVSAIVLAVLAVVLLYVLGDRSGFERSVADEIASEPAYQDLDVDASVVTGIAVGASVLFLVWSLAAIVLAVLTMRGRNGARIALVVSAIGAALVSLVAALAVFPLVITAACIAVAVLLLRGESSAWFAARKGS